jgi:hypothetical protein
MSLVRDVAWTARWLGRAWMGLGAHLAGRRALGHVPPEHRRGAQAVHPLVRAVVCGVLSFESARAAGRFMRGRGPLGFLPVSPTPDDVARAIYTSFPPVPSASKGAPACTSPSPCNL